MVVDNVRLFIFDTLGSITAGLLIALILFLVGEKIYPLPSIGAHWNCERVTKRTNNTIYENMILRYEVILLQKGNLIEGTVEKIYKHSHTERKHLIGEERTRGRASGYVEPNYFSKSQLFLHIVEDEFGRESTHFYDMAIESNERMVGKFTSTLANQFGDMACKKNDFGSSPKTLASKSTSSAFFW